MKDKVCLICKTSIDTDKEFCEFKHYKKLDEIWTKAYYHVKCFRDRMNGAEEQRSALKYAVGTLKKVNEKMGLKPDEVVEI
jgi:hypothetical protein